MCCFPSVFGSWAERLSHGNSFIAKYLLSLSLGRATNCEGRNAGTEFCNFRLMRGVHACPSKLKDIVSAVWTAGHRETAVWKWNLDQRQKQAERTPPGRLSMLSILEHRNKKVIEKLCDVNVANNMDCFIRYTKLIGNDHLKLHFNLSFKIYLVWIQLHLFSSLQNCSWSIL
jgi:hypothetical protein